MHSHFDNWMPCGIWGISSCDNCRTKSPFAQASLILFSNVSTWYFIVPLSSLVDRFKAFGMDNLSFVDFCVCFTLYDHNKIRTSRMHLKPEVEDIKTRHCTYSTTPPIKDSVGPVGKQHVTREPAAARRYLGRWKREVQCCSSWMVPGKLFQMKWCLSSLATSTQDRCLGRDRIVVASSLWGIHPSEGDLEDPKPAKRRY